MAGSIESIQEGRESHEANPLRMSLMDRVNVALRECWQVDTNLGQYEGIWTKRLLYPGDPQELISVDPEGDIVPITVREKVLRNRVKARKQAELAAPGSLRIDIREELEEKGTGKLTASMVAFVAVGARTESIAEEFGLSDNQVQQAVESFLIFSWQEPAETGASHALNVLRRVLASLEQNKANRLNRSLIAKLKRLIETKPRAHLNKRFFLLTRGEMERIRNVGFNLLGIKPLGQTLLIGTLFPVLDFPEGRASVIDLSSRTDEAEPEAARVVLLQSEQSARTEYWLEDKKDGAPPYAICLLKPKEFQELQGVIIEEE